MAYLKHHDIQPVMITGDAKQTGEAVAADLGIKQVVTNVLPDQKVAVVKQLQETMRPIAMVGDGVNDAGSGKRRSQPALRWVQEPMSPLTLPMWC